MTLLTDGLLIKPYALQYYNVTYDPFTIALINVMNGTIKCRGYLAHFTQYFPPHLFGTPYAYAESTLCGLTPRTTIDGYQASCHNDSRTFCNRSSLCISATRIRDGFLNCEDGEDEQLQDRTACATVQRHRFRCSNEEETCLVVSALADATERCLETTEPSSRGIQAIMLTTQCTSQAKTDCPLLRRLIAASWNHSLYYSSDLQSSQLKKIPFRSFCDTFRSLCQQITHLRIDLELVEKIEERLQPLTFALILSSCPKLAELEFVQYIWEFWCAKSSFSFLLNAFQSATLTRLKITVTGFVDCLLLLDGRCESLSTLIIHVNDIYDPVMDIGSKASPTSRSSQGGSSFRF